MSVEITVLKFDALPDDETYMLTNGANEILSSDGGGTNAGIRNLDIGVFAHYDNTTKPGGVLQNTVVDISKFTVLLDSQTTSAEFEDSMKNIMNPIISKVGNVPVDRFSSDDGQAITPKINEGIGTKPTYFAGSVIKAMSNPDNKKYIGVYHIKAINYNHVPEPDIYPDIPNDAVVQGYRIFVDYYVAIIRDFLNNETLSKVNTLYLAQYPGTNFGGHAVQFYTFLLKTIYLLLKLNVVGIKQGKKILFNLGTDDIKIPNEAYLWDPTKFNDLYPEHYSNPVKKIQSAPIFARRLQLKLNDFRAGGEHTIMNGVQYGGYFYKKILPYIKKEVTGLFGPPAPPGPPPPGPGPGNGPPGPDLVPPYQDNPVIIPQVPAIGLTPVVATDTNESDEELYVTFYNTMETWINDATLEKMFSGRQIVTTDIWLNDLYGKNDNRAKIKMIFDYLRNLNKPSFGGGASLDDFKKYIRDQINKIKISQ